MRIHVLAAMLIVTPALAASPAGVSDTSFRDAEGHRVQQLQIDIDAPIAMVWAAFTTDAGFTSWCAPVAHVTLGNDGMIEASFRLTSRIVDPENIDRRAAELVDRLAHNAPVTMRVSKEAIRRVLASAQLEADDLIEEAYGSADFRQGVASFVEKRRPEWSGPRTCPARRG